MMKATEISVIVPNYNYAHYLPERIESILNQTFTDFELILLDDASTDNSREILERYSDNEHVSHFIINETNTGSPFRQWMKGIQLARGNYIWIAEADDLSDPNFLESSVRQIKQYHDVAICYVGSRLIDAAGNVIKKDINHWGVRKKREAACFDGKEFAVHNLYWQNYTVNASGIVFSREKALELTDSPFLRMRYCGDWLFWFEMSLKGKVIEIYRNLNYFRQHDQKVTASSRKRGDGILEDIQIVKYMEEVLGERIKSYKKHLPHGLLYRKIMHLSLKRSQKKMLFNRLRDTLGSGTIDYQMIRFNRFVSKIGIPLLCAKTARLR